MHQLSIQRAFSLSPVLSHPFLRRFDVKMKTGDGHAFHHPWSVMETVRGLMLTDVTWRDIWQVPYRPHPLFQSLGKS
jgi:hypothetical protein